MQLSGRPDCECESIIKYWKYSSTYSVNSSVFLVTRDYRRHDDVLLGLGGLLHTSQDIDSDELGKTQDIYKET